MDNPRALEYLRTYGLKYNGIYKDIYNYRLLRGRQISNWPEYCYAPLALASRLVFKSGVNATQNRLVQDSSIIAALSAWKQTQGIYRFDSTIQSALWDTNLQDVIPADIFKMLPEWCIYVEVDTTISNTHINGFFAHLNYVGPNEEELRILLDADNDLIPVAINLKGTLNEFLVSEELSMEYIGLTGSAYVGNPSTLLPILNLILYLCSKAAEFKDHKGSNRQPGIPPLQKTKAGLKQIPAAHPTVWDVAFRLGSAFRSALERENYNNDGGNGDKHASPRPHIRRAHWHTVLSGPRSEERIRELRWFTPIAVNVDEDAAIIPTIKKVK